MAPSAVGRGAIAPTTPPAGGGHRIGEPLRARTLGVRLRRLDEARGRCPARAARSPRGPCRGCRCAGRAPRGWRTTASVPPPNSTAVARRSRSWPRRRPRPSQLGRAGPSARAACRAPPPAPPRSDRRAARRPGRRRPRRTGAGRRSRGRARRSRPLESRPAPAARSASPVQASRRTSAGATPAARQTSASSRVGPRPHGRRGRLVPALRIAARPRREPGGPSAPVAGPPACRRRPRSVPRGSRTPPSGDTASPSTRRVTGWSATPGPAPDGPAAVSQSADPSPCGRVRAGSSGGSTLSTSWSSAAASTAADRSGCPRASIARASQPATSATARACATNQVGGSRESSRAAAADAPGDRHRTDGTRRPLQSADRPVGRRLAGRDRWTPGRRLGATMTGPWHGRRNRGARRRSAAPRRRPAVVATATVATRPSSGSVATARRRR